MDVAEAKIKREALLKVVRRLDEFIKQSETLDAEIQHIVGNGAIAPLTATGTLTATPPLTEGKAESIKARVEKIVAELITTNGPINKSRIMDELQTRNIDVGSADPGGKLATILSRAEQFKHDRATGLWSLTRVQ